MKKPSFQFYPGDWRKDQNLSLASKAAKGVFIDIMCLAFECEKRGVLKTGKNPWTIEQIAYAVGGDINENIKCIKELLTLNVLKKDRKNTIFQSRIVRDEAKNRKNIENGKLGAVHGYKGKEFGNLGGRPVKKPPIITPVKPPPSSSSSSSSSSSIQTKENVCMDKLKTDRHFFEKIAMAWNVTEKTFNKMLLDFSITINKEHKDYEDYRNHFFNWGAQKYLKYNNVEIFTDRRMENVQ